MAFFEASAQVGLDFVHRNGMSGEKYIVEIIGAGAAWVDYDGDGDLDLYLRQGGPLAGETPTDGPGGPAAATAEGDRLLRNDRRAPVAGEPAVRFVDVSRRAGIGAFGYGMGIATGDIDNDGFVDLYLTNFGPNRLLRNRGDGTFQDVTAAADVDDPRWSVPATFFDLDRDGRLDLYVGNYLDYSFTLHRPCRRADSVVDYCGPLTYRPVTDRLFRNLGDGTFADVGRQSGVASRAGSSLGAAALDVDGDGWLDLYVANDHQENFLWVNRADGTFTEEGLLRGAAVNAAGLREASMGVAVGDADGDGDEDLFLTHLKDETNTLYLNQGGDFRDATAASGLGPPSLPSTGFGAGWIDFDGDGTLDLLTVNGEVRILDDQARAGDPLPLRQRKQLFHAQGEARFVDASPAGGPVFDRMAVGRGAAFGDLDNDGDADVLVTNNNARAELLLNQLAQERPWLGVRVLDAHGRDSLGARVEIHRRVGSPIHRWVRTDGSYASASDPRLLAALSETADVERLAVRWPSGRSQELRLPARDVYLTLYEPRLASNEATEGPRR